MFIYLSICWHLARYLLWAAMLMFLLWLTYFFQATMLWWHSLWRRWRWARVWSMCFRLRSCMYWQGRHRHCLYWQYKQYVLTRQTQTLSILAIQTICTDNVETDTVYTDHTNNRYWQCRHRHCTLTIQTIRTDNADTDTVYTDNTNNMYRQCRQKHCIITPTMQTI